MTFPDWQLPPGVDRGLWDYLHSREMVHGYDAQMAASPLATADLRFCDDVFTTPGRLIDLGCGTGRLCVHFARKGYDCVGVDLSPEMLAKARENMADVAGDVALVAANLIDLSTIADQSFDFAACLFSTLGMIRGGENRSAAMRSMARVLKPEGRLVLHVHNRWFRGLGWKRFRTADVTMPQAYGGAALTLHHFTRHEVTRLLDSADFQVTQVVPVSVSGLLRHSWLAPSTRAYGFLVAATRS